jgi:cytoskeletal protein RodZ
MDFLDTMSNPESGSSEGHDKTRLVICPFLGIKGESSTQYRYPSHAHCCYNVKFPDRIQLAYQEKFCLSDLYNECEVFNSSGEEHLPAHIQAERRKRRTPSYFKSWILIPLLIGLTILLVTGILVVKDRYSRTSYGGDKKTSTPIPTHVITNSSESIVSPPTSTTIPDIPTGTNTNTSTPSDDILIGVPSETTTNTPTPRPTGTKPATLTPGPSFETPFGPDQSYVLYRVGDGESYAQIAEMYDTSTEVLRESNIRPESTKLLSGMIILVLPGVHEIEGTQKFIIIFVDRRTEVKALAEKYQVDVEEIQKYNSLSKEDWISAGRWLIIPQYDFK